MASPDVQPNQGPAARPKKPRAVAPTRPTLWEILRGFDPDPRWFVPAQAAAWAYVLAAVPVWAHLPWWSVVAAGAVLTVVTVAAVRHRYSAQRYGRAHRRHVLSLTVIAGVVGSAWTGTAAIVRPTNVVVLGVLILGALMLGGAYALLATRRVTEIAKAEQATAAVAAEQAAADQEDEFGEWAAILDAAGLAGMTVVEKLPPTRSGYTLRVLSSSAKTVSLSEMAGACEAIAIVAGRRLGLRLASDHIGVEATDRAGEYLLHITTDDYLARSIAYPVDDPVGTITRPVRVGHYRDGAPLLLDMCGVHTIMIGATGSGKSVLTNDVLAAVTRTADCRAWVGACDKLLPLVVPWLWPWLAGQTERPVLDRVAGEDPREVLLMLADAYRYAKLYNQRLGKVSRRTPTPQEPALVVVLEESSALLIDNADVTITTFDGKRMNGSQLIVAITRAARTAPVALYMISQFALMDAFGGSGPLVKRNVTQRIVGRTLSDYDGRETLIGVRGNVNTTLLRNNTVLVQPSTDVPRTMPAKAFVLDGLDQIAPVAIRNASNQPRLASWIAAELGDSYASRWDPTRLPELAALVAAEGLAWPTAAVAGTPSAPAGQVALPAPADEELHDMSETADAKMDAAIANLERWGPLGETMARVTETVRAENAPEFVGAGHLAFVIGRVGEDGDWDAAGRALADELAARPWLLATEVRDGSIGWARDVILARAREYLTGDVEPSLMDLLISACEGIAGHVSTEDLARAIGRIGDGMSEAEIQAAKDQLAREITAATGLSSQQRRNAVRYGDHCCDHCCYLPAASACWH